MVGGAILSNDWLKLSTFPDLDKYTPYVLEIHAYKHYYAQKEGELVLSILYTKHVNKQLRISMLIHAVQFLLFFCP